MDYSELVGVYEKLEKTTKRLEMTKIIADFLVTVPDEELPTIILFLQGRAFPAYSDKELGIAKKLMVKAVSQASGIREREIEDEIRETGDSGLAAEKILAKKSQTTLFREKLTVERVSEILNKIASFTGTGSQEKKLSYISELLSSAEPNESRYLTRLILEELRLGVGDGIVRDAIAGAFFAEILWKDLLWQKKDGKRRIEGFLEKVAGKNILIDADLDDVIKKDENLSDYYNIFLKNNNIKIKKIDGINPGDIENFNKILLLDAALGNELRSSVLGKIDRTYNLTSDMGEVAKISKTKGIEGLDALGIELGRPMKVMLAKLSSIEKSIADFGKCAFEIKYDGARVQIHKKGDSVELFTRRLENVTKQFPEIVESAKNNIKAGSAVVEGEVVAVQSKESRRPRPFQDLSRRIKRKYKIEEMVKSIPVEINLFDVIYKEDKSLINTPFKERRKILEGIITPTEKFRIADQIIASDPKEAEKFYKKALEMGHEGVMAKNLDALYQPGSRVGYMHKVKPVMETLDLVIIGATWGEGRRAHWLGSFLLAARDPTAGKFLTIGRMGTGLTDDQFKEMTSLLKELIVEEAGKEVKLKPEVVVEVAYEEIQKSPTYGSGYALRFPRLVRIRNDKGADDADTLERIEGLL
ncbi:MAG: hypothetical protein A7316_03795 [Candidatus Altiarchaeales archaeon WOR_SM1_86-2]|nr:MAG: hypothetical protein A7316_03795 [Candidatus Altiarchaeales archaeon WOR_SM1_86-2]ODS37732.1 MAG: hypothetical protein A7315_03800 [Candidatus Altiarchaeales archaeon WOR_SM1_79]